MQDVTIGGNWVKGAWGLSVPFPISAYESMILAKSFAKKTI